MEKLNNFSRLVALILFIAMSLSVFAGCVPGNGHSGDNGGSTGGDEIADPKPNPNPNPDPEEPETPDSPGTHTCVFGEWVVVKVPTTDTEGLQERKCECSEVEQKVIPASGTEFAIYYNNLNSAEYPTPTGYNSADGLLELPKPEADGYNFIGWYTKSVGGEIVDYIPKGSTGDVVLYAHWELVTYDITYKNVPNNTNPTSYNIETKLKLETPKWSGLVFTYWSDENGNIYSPDENITSMPEKMYGDITLTANWKVLRNIATPAAYGSTLYNVFSGEEGMLYFFYDLGTIEHVVLDDIDPNLYYKAEGMPISLTLSKTVSISEEKANSISNTISQSISKTSSWSTSMSMAESHSKNWNAEIGGGIDIGIGGGHEGGVSVGDGILGGSLKKMFNWSVGLHVEGKYGWGGSDTTSSEWGSTESFSSTSEETQSKTVNSSLTYKNEITSEITESYSIGADLPSGYYAYVHAGNIRVIGVVTYEIATGYMYLNTYSHLDNMHSMIMYYSDVNQLNNPSVEGLDFTIPEEEIVNFVENCYYVKYDANGGEGTMPITLHSIDGNERLADNKFTKNGCTFAGWELETDDGVQMFLDGQSITNISTPHQVVTLKAVWEGDPDLDVVYNLTTKNGKVSSSPNINYTAVIEYRNRTADSVEIRIKWTSTIGAGSWTVYGQNFKFSVGSVSSGRVKVNSFNTWAAKNQPSRSSTTVSNWITVPLSTTAATKVNISLYYWQTNSNDVDMNKYDGTAAINTTWSIDIPACK